jgi:response regulator RpfG family c-di-GMP phosphodiesterase
MSRIKTLLVDSNYDFMDALSYLLEKADIIARLAPNKLKAIELIESWKPHVVVIETNKNFNGFDVINEIMQQYGNDDVQFIGMTMFYSASIENQLKETHAKAYIVRSMDADQIIRVIKDVYSGKQVFINEHPKLKIF